ncbi:MAG TPA: allantoinase AllB, partial [Jatrophihabitans sp.]
VVTGVLARDAASSASVELTLAPDEVLIPGLVDTHVHINEPGRTEWEGFATATRAAARGGVTTLIDMPLNSIPPTIDAEALAVKRRAAEGACAVDVGFWGGAVPSNVGALKELHADGVFGFKCFLIDSGVAEFPPLSADELASVLAEVAALDALLIVHAEDRGTIESAPVPHGRSYADFLASRPAEAEDTAIRTLLSLAGRSGARVHVLHLSSASALPLIAAAKAAGLRVSAETCPHYLTLSAEEIADGRTEFKCCPPIRTTENQDALWQALSAGTIDLIVSDHSPCPADLKRFDTGDFGAAWGGVSSLQLGLSLIWTHARRRGLPLTDVVRWMAERPAELAGLSDKGRIVVGSAADFAVFAPDEAFTVDAAALAHRHAVTPYQGQTLTGVVRSTWLAGRRIVDQPAGRLLSRTGC